MPVPRNTPARVGSSKQSPASLTACALASSANCAKRSRSGSLAFGNRPSASKSTSPATLASSCPAKPAEILRIPDRPARRLSKKVPQSLPVGLTIPMPVIATRWRTTALGGPDAIHQVGDVPHRGERGRIERYRRIEDVLEPEHDLDHTQRIDAHLVELALRRELVRAHVERLRQNRLYGAQGLLAHTHPLATRSQAIRRRGLLYRRSEIQGRARRLNIW